MAEEMRVTAVLGYAETKEAPEMRTTTLLGYMEASLDVKMVVSAVFGYVEVVPGAATGRKYGPAVQ